MRRGPSQGKIGTELGNLEAAEGETVPTIVVERRIDIRSMED